MLLTYKVKHYQDYTQELEKAKHIAQYAVATKSRTSKDVKEFGIKSAIANQILKKYSNNKTIKKVSRVKLTVPAQSIKVNKEISTITVVPLRLTLKYHFPNTFIKVNQVELDHEYAYISVTVPEKPMKEATSFIGVDSNTTGHCAVAAYPVTGEVRKLGKKALHIHKKYSQQRRRYQRKGKLKKLKASKNRERRIIKDMLHKASRDIVEFAQEHDAGIKLENLKGIRNRAKTKHSFKHSLHSWPYYQLTQLISYKAKLLGIPVIYVNPAYTSKDCSRCYKRGSRNGKSFKCHECGHVDHADVNAAFNIALRQEGIDRLSVDRVAFNRRTDTLEEATL
jgi:putative transposase